MTYKDDCRYFTGYKPCQFKRPCDGCDQYAPVAERICIVSLDAMGAVLRSTCLLPAIKRKYPNCHITWITYPVSKPLLDHNPMIDRILVMDAKTSFVFSHLTFDVLYAVDKSLEAGALAEQIKADKKFGFGLLPSGVIRKFNEEASYQYDLGLDDHAKFFVNQKPETQQTTESMALEWVRDPYVLALTEAEKSFVAKERSRILSSGAKGIIGFNTGCSVLYPYKKFTVERAIETIRMWREHFPQHAVALLGGPEDSDRQVQMKQAFAHDPLVVNTPTRNGLREGVLWMGTADMVFSGCSLGLHIAIALKKPVVCWFGVSVAEEIDVYDNGIKLKAKVPCSPCWKKSCSNEPKCYDMVPVTDIKDATAKILTAQSLRS